MNVICFSATKPHVIYRWTMSAFKRESNSFVQLIHPNKRYNGLSPVVICWFVETYIENKKALEDNNAFIILMDDRPNMVIEQNLMPIDHDPTNKRVIPTINMRQFHVLVSKEFQKNYAPPIIPINQTRSPGTISKKNKLLLSYINEFRYEFFEFEIDKYDSADLENFLKNKTYFKPPFNLTHSRFLHLCNNERYKEWIRLNNIVVQYPLHVLLSLRSRDLEYINKMRIKYSNETPSILTHHYSSLG